MSTSEKIMTMYAVIIDVGVMFGDVLFIFKQGFIFNYDPSQSPE